MKYAVALGSGSISLGDFVNWLFDYFTVQCDVLRDTSNTLREFVNWLVDFFTVHDVLSRKLKPGVPHFVRCSRFALKNKQPSLASLVGALFLLS
jgi:hypothetical protein